MAICSRDKIRSGR